jgi:hypothetical protein
MSISFSSSFPAPANLPGASRIADDIPEWQPAEERGQKE